MAARGHGQVPPAPYTLPTLPYPIYPTLPYPTLPYHTLSYTTLPYTPNREPCHVLTMIRYHTPLTINPKPFLRGRAGGKSGIAVSSHMRATNRPLLEKNGFFLGEIGANARVAARGHGQVHAIPQTLNPTLKTEKRTERKKERKKEEA